MKSLLRLPAAWVLVYAALWFSIGLLPMVPTDLDLYFWPSAQTALAGHPLMPYAPGGQASNTNDNGPLALVPLTAVGAVVEALGWMQNVALRRALVQAVFSLFIVLMATEAVAAIERLRGARLRPRSRLLTYGALLFGPPLWQSLQGYGHIEQALEVWFVLVAIRWLNRGWMVRAGIAFGLALLCRTAAVFFVIPVLTAAWWRGPAAATRLAIAAAATGLVGLLPFYLSDPADVTHSLAGFRGVLPVGVGSIWTFVRGTSLEGIAQHWDVAFVVAAALASNVWLATRRGGFIEERQFAGLALTSAGFILFAKAVWPYYFMEAYVFVVVWAVGRWRPSIRLAEAWFPGALICGLGLLAEVGATRGEPWQVLLPEAGAMFVLLTSLVLWIARTGARLPPPVRGEAQVKFS
ncbi:MAG: hypothetical protein ACREOM_10205 [Candidatus Dormibacteraceae bacterium]